MVTVSVLDLPFVVLAGCGGKYRPRAGRGTAVPRRVHVRSQKVEGSAGGGDDHQTDTGVILRGEDVGVCVGCESGDVVSSDGEGNANGQFFWDPLDREDEVQNEGLGGISSYGNKVSLYFWTSADRAKQVYAAARAKHVASSASGARSLEAWTRLLRVRGRL